jgi:acetolactate synthase regulatory subunit
MQWLVTLETEHDMIAVCRLMNVFRRKGMKIATFALATRPEGFSIMSVVETPEKEVEHLFNYLRRTEGVQHVSCYRHTLEADASYVLVDAAPNSSSVAHILEVFPKSKLIFASHGKYLFEIPAEGHPGVLADSGNTEILPLARVMTTQQDATRPELVGAATF